MQREMDTYLASGDAPPATDTPEARWIAWALWSAISLVVVLFAVLVFGADAALLLGWVVGVILTAMWMVFGRNRK